MDLGQELTFRETYLKGRSLLHRRRKRLSELAAQEAEGETLWTDAFDSRVRTRILHEYKDVAEAGWDKKFSRHARRLILRDEGLHYLVKAGVSEELDFETYLLSCHDEMFPTVVEAICATLRDRVVTYGYSGWQTPETFEKAVAVILREHRISYDLVESQMVEFTSRELHVSLVAPTIRLLSGKSGWGDVEIAYLGALEEIAKGKTANAITDGATALQLALLHLGCQGNALGPLIRSAKTKGLIAAHDSPMLDGIERALHWISADRSENGDAHKGGSTNIHDAWLIVHIVGAFIQRLANGTRI